MPLPVVVPGTLAHINLALKTEAEGPGRSEDPISSCLTVESQALSPQWAPQVAQGGTQRDKYSMTLLHLS